MNSDFYDFESSYVKTSRIITSKYWGLVKKESPLTPIRAGASVSAAALGTRSGLPEHCVQSGSFIVFEPSEELQTNSGSERPSHSSRCTELICSRCFYRSRRRRDHLSFAHSLPLLTDCPLLRVTLPANQLNIFVQKYLFKSVLSNYRKKIMWNCYNFKENPV